MASQETTDDSYVVCGNSAPVTLFLQAYGTMAD
jgi:hypothetical protein